MLSGVDASAVVACAAAVRDVLQADGRLPLRGGICTGKVIMFEGDDYIGAAVNVAARLCAKASPGQLLLTAGTAEHLPAGVETVVLGKQPMSGLRQPVDVLALEPVHVRAPAVRPPV
jgi:class 3 adenylate cyclase